MYVANVSRCTAVIPALQTFENAEPSYTCNCILEYRLYSYRLTVVSDSPVVTEVPTAKVSRCLKDRSSSASTSRPALVSGKKAWRRVPRYALPGFGISGSEKEESGGE